MIDPQDRGRLLRFLGKSELFRGFGEERNLRREVPRAPRVGGGLEPSDLDQLMSRMMEEFVLKDLQT